MQYLFGLIVYLAGCFIALIAVVSILAFQQWFAAHKDMVAVIMVASFVPAAIIGGVIQRWLERGSPSK